MALANPVGILLQNLWGTWVYALVFVLVSIFSGAFLGVILAFIVASLGTFAYRRFVNHLLPTPRKTAVLITGCSSGIGADAALRLVKSGFLVFAAVRSEEDATALRKKANNSAMLFPVLLDVTKAEQIAAAVETVKKRLAQEDRKLLGLVNNAGYAEFFAAELSSPDLFRALFEVNVVGVVAVTQAFLPLLREFAQSSTHGARVVLVGSVVGRFTPAGAAAYSASKHAVEAIGDALRMELRKWRIHIAVLEPGSIGSNFLGVVEAKQKKRFAEVKAALEKGQLPAGGAVLEHYLAAAEKTKAAAKNVPHESVAYTSDAIECALLDSQPLSRYTAGWTSLFIQPLTKLPTEVCDALLGRDYA